MGTLSTIGARISRKLRDSSNNIYTKSMILDEMNEVLGVIYRHLQNLESKFVYDHTTVTATEDTAETDISSITHSGFMNDGVWIDDKDNYLKLVVEPDRQALSYEDSTETAEPYYYYLTQDDKMGFIPTPDTTYTVHVYYWSPLTEYALVGGDYPTSDLPWNGVWNEVICRMVVIELMEDRELDTTRHLLMLQNLWEQATSQTYTFGTRQRGKISSDMFEAEGV